MCCGLGRSYLSSFCARAVFANSSMGSPCIDLWHTFPTFCYIEHFEKVRTAHKSHTKQTKLPCPPPKSLPGFAETAPLRMRAVSRGPASSPKAQGGGCLACSCCGAGGGIFITGKVCTKMPANSPHAPLRPCPQHRWDCRRQPGTPLQGAHGVLWQSS